VRGWLIEGEVTIEFDIDTEGAPKDQGVLAGHRLLRAAALDAIRKWEFPLSAAGQKIQSSFIFALNCHSSE
jgi:TonB family protein